MSIKYSLKKYYDMSISINTLFSRSVRLGTQLFQSQVLQQFLHLLVFLILLVSAENKQNVELAYAYLKVGPMTSPDNVTVPWGLPDM